MVSKVISHNIARREIVNNQECWVHRKGATRAFPAHHFALKDTPFYETGHPILLPWQSDGRFLRHGC
jgi:tRNA-splicing ligase RtcB